MANRKGLRKYQDEFVKLYKEGKSLREIASIYGVSKSMVSSYVKEKMELRPKTTAVNQKEEIYEKYINGATINSIRKTFNISGKTVKNILKSEYNIIVETDREFEELIPFLKKGYKEGKSLRSLSSEYGIATDTVATYLESEDISRRDYIESSALRLDVYENYFDIINKENVFNLGLLFALGNIFKPIRGYSAFVNIKIPKFCKDEALNLCKSLSKKNEKNMIKTDDTYFIRVPSEYLSNRLLELGMKKEIPYEFLKENNLLNEFFRGFILGSLNVKQRSLNIYLVQDYSTEIYRFFKEEFNIVDIKRNKLALKFMNINTIHDVIKEFNLLDRVIEYSEEKFENKKTVWDEVKILREEVTG